MVGLLGPLACGTEMRRKTHSWVLLALLLIGSGGIEAQETYRPAEVTVAESFEPPWNIITPGISVLDVSLDATGHLASVDVLREVPLLTNAAESALQSRKFKPASVAGKQQPSDLLVAFVLPPAAAFPPYPVFSPLSPKSGSVSRYAPPGIVSASYAQYPVNSVVSASVIIQVAVGADGNATSWQAIRGLDPFTRFALEAAKKWRFRPATLDDRPVRSNLAIDFIFQPPQGQ